MNLLFVALIGLVLFSRETLGHQNSITNSRDYLLALRRACSQGQSDALLSLLEMGDKSESSLETTLLLHETVKKGYLDMAKILIGHYAFEQNRLCLILRDCFVSLCENQNIRFIQFVISEYPETITDVVFDEALLQAIETGNIELISELTNFKTISPKAVFHVLRSAAKFGILDVFKLVSGDYSKAPNVHMRASFIIACTNGHEELMDWLIEAGVDPSTSRNEGLRAAVSNGHLQIVKRLLSMQNVIDLFDLQKICRKALSADQSEVLEYLITLFKIDSLILDGFLLKSCERNRVRCLSMMLKATCVTPTMAVLNAAIEASNYKAVKVLLKDRRIDPTVNLDQILRDACYFKDLKLVRLLIQDGRVDPSVENCYVLNCLVIDNFAETNRCLRAMLRDPRIEHRIDDAVRIALKNSNFDSALLLYAHPLANIRDVCPSPFNALLEACKTGNLLNVIGDFLDIPMHILEFAVRCSLTHGHVYAFKFAFEEMLEDFTLQLDDMDQETKRTTFFNVIETADYCIFWILHNQLSQTLLHYMGETMQKYPVFDDTKKFPLVSELHHIFAVHIVVNEIFRPMNLQDVAGIILQYHLRDYISKNKI